MEPNAPRELLHLRDITCRGYQREDGLFDIEGYVQDTKTYSYPNQFRKRLDPGDYVHDMGLRLTLNAAFEVVGVQAEMRGTPYGMCPDILPNFQRLVGLKIGRGWQRRVRERIGGVNGCTHLVELLQPVATTAFQTIGSAVYRKNRMAGEVEEDAQQRVQRRPWMLNSCHTWAESSPVVERYFPAFHRPTAQSEPLPKTTDAAPDGKAETSAAHSSA